MTRELARPVSSGRLLGRLVLAWLGAALAASAAVWQWSVPMGSGRAYLWIPPTCNRVRAVVVGQDNLLEQGILEDATFRRTLASLGFAEVFVSPPFDPVFDFRKDAGDRFDAMMCALAEDSGYSELARSPVAPIGHSACASFPWNFAAWDPARTLAILSVKGDAPQTDLTGSGHPNPDWGARGIDGIPALMVMGEDEWWEARLAPAMRYRAAHPQAPIALLADVGHGHFDAFPNLIRFLALFLEKAARARLPASGASESAALIPVDPSRGWLVDRWRAGQAPRAPAAPSADYAGERVEAFWCFDREMAQATEAYESASQGKRIQQVDFVQDGGLVPISNSHAGVFLPFRPLADGVTFRLSGAFIRPLPPTPPVAAKDRAPPLSSVTPVAASAGDHAQGPVMVSRVVGPVVQIDATTFRLSLERNSLRAPGKSADVWLLAWNAGDAAYRSAVQQGVMKIPIRTRGAAQTLSFDPIPDQKVGASVLKLEAVSGAGAVAPVGFYVREGPAEVCGNELRLTQIPPRARMPIAVTVVAWQLGRDADPQLRAAAPVERTFWIRR